MLLITKIRIGTAILAAILFIGGCKAAVHPKIVVVATRAEPTAGADGPGGMIPEVAISQTSRVFGILRMAAGAGLAWYALWYLRRGPGCW